MGVNWNKPIEAVHTDGRVVPVSLRATKIQPDGYGDYQTANAPGGDANKWWHSDGESCCNSRWHIRNVPPQPPTPEQRAMDLAKALAGVPRDSVLGQSGYASEARAIMAEVEPVDVDLVAARRIAADNAYRPDTASYERVVSGIDDNSLNVKTALAAIAKGRALERGEV